MDYKTIRSIQRIKKDNHDCLTDILTKKKFEDSLKPRLGETIILLKMPEFAKNNNLIGGTFEIIMLNDFKFVNNSQNALWVSILANGYSQDLQGTYDIMFPSTIKQNNKYNNKNLKNLKLFEFLACRGGEGEQCSLVMHLDPFLAYNSLMKSSHKTYSSQQELNSVININSVKKRNAVKNMELGEVILMYNSLLEKDYENLLLAINAIDMEKKITDPFRRHWDSFNILKNN